MFTEEQQNETKEPDYMENLDEIIDDLLGSKSSEIKNETSENIDFKPEKSQQWFDYSLVLKMMRKIGLIR